MEEINFVIAKKWDTNKPATLSNLGIYTYFNDLHTGTVGDARQLLAYVQHRNPDTKYKIYQVTIGEPLE